MQESVPPKVDYAERPGRWVAETAWPTSNNEPTDFWLDGKKLSSTTPKEEEITVSSIQQHGLYSGVWCPFGQPGDLASDQRLEDGLSVCFTSNPLDSTMEILGFPEVTVELSSDRPNALLAVRLCDIAPDGSSTLVTWGMLNLTHRESHEYPTPLVPGERYTVTIQLNAIGHALPQGHRWRVALSPTYWPHAWPSPEPVTLKVFTGEKTRLTLPVRQPQASDEQLPPFQGPETAAVLEREILREECRTRKVHHDLIHGVWTLDDYSDEGARRLLKNGMEYGSTNRNIYTIKEGDPLSAKVRCEWTMNIGRGDWQTYLESVSTMTADAKHFFITNELTAFEGENQVFTKTWKTEIPRDLV
jgi:hypothetical protein